MTFGIIGTNFISDRFCAALPFAESQAIAVYSRKRETGEAFAAKHGIPLVFTDLSAFLASQAFRAVYIASPNACHEEQSILAMQKGKHVLCEKPIAPSLEAFLRMQRTAEKTGCVLVEAMRPYYDSLWHKIRSYLPALGTIRGGHLSFCQYSSRYDRFLAGERVNTFDPSLSNAALLDIGIYPIAASVFLFGAPHEVCGKSTFLPGGFEGAGDAILHYGTHTLSIGYSKVADCHTPSVIIGERGSLSIDKISCPTRASLRLRTGEETVLTHEDCGAPDNMYEEVRAFSEAVKEGNICPLWQESAWALAICDRLRREANIRFPSDEASTN